MTLRLLLAAALVLAGCAAGTSNGFTATAPGGWEDRTDTAETRTGTDFEVVYEGTAVEGFLPTITVSRVESESGLEAAARRARIAVDRRFEEADPTRMESVTLGGRPAFAFEYRVEDKRSRYVTAAYDGHLYAVTVQAAGDGFARARRVFDAYLASWRWE